MVGRMDPDYPGLVSERTAGWAPVVLEIVRLAVDVVKIIEQLSMGKATGAEKLEAAVMLQRGQEPSETAQTQELAAAREALLSAQVAYANALAAAQR